ncbi:GH92 family glycosyl hydrolase [Maribacter sp. HTCC2170]|uniref:GH92 family glycosyl hydrolase n=1 Tax=Maribacter sp. (strain HTCC2170 / KCCM 42371) TaxID=313603 RepID=UPI00006BD3B4|nr:GH92 family glycosyl hydrolase [Maribacter sp. HTCC2170]EAR02942.1 putative alpha-1,2-mannosidase [Maribacter sp. HTCC2170]
MKQIIAFLIILLCFASCKDNKELQQQKPLHDLVQYVDPQIGSVHGRWFFYTPAARPFGMAKLAPHTNAYNSQGGWGPTGYDDRHTSIEGFGHFHEFQIGGLVFMPTVGELKTVPGTLEDPDIGYRSRFYKKDETAEPGYYKVRLKNYNIKAEITATERVGYHRYTFPKTKEANVIIDIGHKQGESSDVVSAHAKLVNDTEIEGYIETNPEYAKFCDPGKTVKMYFVARLGKEALQMGSFVNEIRHEGAVETIGTDNGLYLTFNMEKDSVLEIQTGLSYTSIANARLNLKTETNGKTFESVKQESKDDWNKKLNKIVVEGGKKEDRVKFYTGLYHALLGRGLSNDANGDYPLSEDKIGHTALNEKGKPKYNHYNTDGIWGGFWNLSQVWALAYPDYFSDYIQSNIDFYKDTGWLHDGTANGVFTNGVQTNFQGLLLASAYNVGIRDFDVKTGYEAALKNELEYNGRNLGNGKYDLSYFVKDKYVPYKDTIISNGWVFNFGASHTLEYSFSSYAVAQMAKDKKDEVNYEKLMKQADYYKNLFDPVTKFIRPKLKNGSFIKDFDPMKGWDGFQEGNAYQFTWYVPQDPKGLIDLVGKPLFNERLETMFNDAQKSMFGGGSEEIHSFSGVEKLYNHGNQPCLHNPWLFNYSGKPWLTQKWVRTICNEFYGTEPLHGYGVGQDEDQGQLGAWYVMASLGLFDVQGHTSANPSFQFGSPLFERITIQLDNDYYEGKELVLETKNQSQENLYIQSLSFNGKPVNNNWMYRKELINGGKLIFELGPEPNKQWGIEVLPPSMSNEK